MALKLTAEQAEEIVNHLQGTCDDVCECIAVFDWLKYVDENEAVDAVNAAAQNGGIERCDTCSWWVETNEVDSNGNCEDCADGDEDDGGGE